MTSHGMMFQAPEVMNVHQSAPVQITAKTDLYLLGLLILYVCLATQIWPLKPIDL